VGDHSHLAIAALGHQDLDSLAYSDEAAPQLRVGCEKIEQQQGQMISQAAPHAGPDVAVQYRSVCPWRL